MRNVKFQCCSSSYVGSKCSVLSQLDVVLSIPFGLKRLHPLNFCLALKQSFNFSYIDFYFLYIFFISTFVWPCNNDLMSHRTSEQASTCLTLIGTELKFQSFLTFAGTKPHLMFPRAWITRGFFCFFFFVVFSSTTNLST